MRTNRSLTAAAAAALLALLLSTLALAAPAAAAPTTAQTYIVTLAPGGGDVAALASSLLTRVGGGAPDRVFAHALRGFTVRLPAAAATALQLLPGVAAVEPDGVVTLGATEAPTPSWGLDRVDQANLPLSGSYTYASTGAGVRAYMIDTGIQASNVDFGGRAVPGTNTVDTSPSTQDCNGHGTHTAGTTGGTAYGIAKQVTLVAVRVFGCASSTTTAAIIAGVDWATADHQPGQPAVANMSLGGSASAALDTAVQNLINDGVTVAIASGNDNANGCNGSPARVAAGITVGATDSNDNRASFSNYGTCVDVHAPGVNIVSDYMGADNATATLSGTSMATPHVTGAAARYLSSNPSATPAQVQAAIVGTATPGKVKGIATSCTFFQQLLGSCTAGTPNRLLFASPAT